MDIQAVIIAGGLGRRLRPLTEEVPKSMVTILGRPYLEYQVRWLRLKGIDRILFLIGYLGEKIKAYFKNGNSFGVNITYSQEPMPLGTGGSLKLAEKELEANFILIYGDSFLPLDFLSLTKYFYHIHKTGVVVIYDNHLYNTGVLNNLRLGKNGVILKYKKNCKDPDLNFTDAGIMVFKKEVLSLIPKNTNVSLEEEIFPLLIKRRQLAGYISEQPFYDIGTKKRLKRFEMVICNNILNFPNESF